MRKIDEAFSDSLKAPGDVIPVKDLLLVRIERVLQIGRAARTFTQAGHEQLKLSYKKLIGLTQGVRAQAAAVLKALKAGQLVARQEAFLKVVSAEASLKHYLPLVEKVITQSRARIFQAQTRHPDK